MDILVHPSSVGSLGRGDRLIAPGGAQIAFVFLMLFLVSIAVVMLGLTATGIGFEDALTLAVAGLTTTGPLIRTLESGIAYSDLSGAAQGLLGVAMIVGRLEALVLVALFNPAYWR
jgi:trk system potassium uptake protein TrkH